MVPPVPTPLTRKSTCAPEEMLIKMASEWQQAVPTPLTRKSTCAPAEIHRDWVDVPW